MANVDDIKDEKLRTMCKEAFGHMRKNDGYQAVVKLVDGYMYLMDLKPEVLTEILTMGRWKMPVVLRWPRLGANIKRAQVGANNKPEIEITRDKFGISEAMTYYEFLLEFAIKRGI